MRTNELEADYFSTQTMPKSVMRFDDIEGHAATVYTRESFLCFQEELWQETLYHLHEPITEQGFMWIYYLRKY